MLHEKLRELREKKGVLQSEISKYLSVTRESYSMYETGKRQMSFETLCLLANYFEVSTDYLLGRQDALPSFLNEEERIVIAQYRELEEHARDAVKNVLSFELSRTPKAEGMKKSVM